MMFSMFNLGIKTGWSRRGASRVITPFLSLSLTTGVRVDTLSLFINNLHPETDKKDLWNHFKQYGIIKKDGLYVNHKRSFPTYGFVRFVDEKSVERALRAPPLVIMGHTIGVERSLFNYDTSVFTGDMPVHSELVLSLYRKGDKLVGRIHGYWYSNLKNGKVITLKNSDNENLQLIDQIKELVEAELKGMGQGRAMLWRPPGAGKRASAPKHLKYQQMAHNVYEGKIFRADCIKVATEKALPYMSTSGPSSLVSFFELFKEHLAKVKDDPSAGEDDLDILGKFAKSHYGYTPRITVKSDTHVDVAFLFDAKENPMDHLLTTPKGSAEAFYNFCNM